MAKDRTNRRGRHGRAGGKPQPLANKITAGEEYFTRLRNQVNSLSEGQQPFPDPASDYTLSFYDHPAYPEFAEVLMDGEPFSKIDG